MASVVVVAVCAPAMAQEIARNKAVPKEVSGLFHAALNETNNTDWQKRSGDRALRETFTLAGISNLSTHAANWCSHSGKSPTCRADREVVLCKGLCCLMESKIFRIWDGCDAENIS